MNKLAKIVLFICLGPMVFQTAFAGTDRPTWNKEINCRGGSLSALSEEEHYCLGGVSDYIYLNIIVECYDQELEKIVRLDKFALYLYTIPLTSQYYYGIPSRGEREKTYSHAMGVLNSYVQKLNRTGKNFSFTINKKFETFDDTEEGSIPDKMSEEVIKERIEDWWNHNFSI